MPHYSHVMLVERAVASPIPIPPRPEASPSPIVLFPGENPADLNGAPFTTLPASVLSSLPPNAFPTPSPVAPPRPPSQASSTTKTASFASLTSTHQNTPTSIPSSSAMPASNDSSSQPAGTSPTTIGVVVSLVLVVALGVIGYAVYRFHLRKKLMGKSDAVKLLPLITGKVISRPTLIPMQGSQTLPDEKPEKFRRTRQSLAKQFKYTSKLPHPKTISPSTYSESTYNKNTTNQRQANPLGRYDTTDTLEYYGSEVSYPSTYVTGDFDGTWYKPSPAHIPRVLNPGRLQNVPFKLPS